MHHILNTYYIRTSNDVYCHLRSRVSTQSLDIHTSETSSSLNPTSTWVLTMSPFMCTILSKADFIEVDATFRASVELTYLLNVVCFDYSSILCE